MHADPQSLIPRHKLDLERAKALVQLGYPAVHPVLPELFVWIQDMNWPVAQIIAPFLATIGAPLIPEIRRVLATSDSIWKYWVLVCIVKELPVDVVVQLQDDFQLLLDHLSPDDKAEEVDLITQEMLAIAKEHAPA